MPLSDQQIRQFTANGFLAGIPITPDTETQHFREEFDRLEAREGREKCLVGLFDPHFSEQFVWELASHPAILDCIEGLLGPNLLLMASHFFCIYGPSEGFVAWHQDMTYW